MRLKPLFQQKKFISFHEYKWLVQRIFNNADYFDGYNL